MERRYTSRRSGATGLGQGRALLGCGWAARETRAASSLVSTRLASLRVAGLAGAMPLAVLLEASSVDADVEARVDELVVVVIVEAIEALVRVVTVVAGVTGAGTGPAVVSVMATSRAGGGDAVWSAISAGGAASGALAVATAAPPSCVWMA
jgi:hypothetical protein